jgi:hypothetical protein
MAKAVKFSISLSEKEYKALEAARRKAGRSRSQFIREALEARGARDTGGVSDGVHEDRDAYRSPLSPDIVDIAELRKRAIEAAGKLESGVPDLSIGHDAYLADAQAAGPFDSKRVGWVAREREKP